MPKAFWVLSVLSAITIVHCDEYEKNIEFVLHHNGQKSISTFNKTMTEQGCDVNGKFAIVTHGWLGSSEQWNVDLISNLTFYRSGCIIFMNYSYYSDRINYVDVVKHFQPISKLLTRKLHQLRDDGVSSDDIFMFGFSLGGRLVIDAAILFGPNRIGRIDGENKRAINIA